MGNKPFSHKRRSSSTVKQNIRYDLEYPYKEGWLYKQSRHLKKWRKRWIVINSDFIYTFTEKQRYVNPTEIIDLKYFTYISKETALEEAPSTTHHKFASLTKRFSLRNVDEDSNSQPAAQETIYLILISDLNNDETFTFKCESQQSQMHWLYSLERALEYKSNLMLNIIRADILKYIVSLYFLSYERLALSRISRGFAQLFSARHYNNQYHYIQDAVFWSQHFHSMVKHMYSSNRQQSALRGKYEDPLRSIANVRKSLSLHMNGAENGDVHRADDEQEEKKETSVSLEELQFSEASFHLTSQDWMALTKDDRLQLKYFFIFYHEFSALNYQRIQKNQSELSSYYIRSRPKYRMYRREDGKDRTKHRRKARGRQKRKRRQKHRKADEEDDADDRKREPQRSKAKKIGEKHDRHEAKQYAKTFVSIRDITTSNESMENDIHRSSSGLLHYRNVRDKSRRYSDDEMSDVSSDGSVASNASAVSAISSVCGDSEVVSEEIIEELNKLELKYENIRLDGYEWNAYFNKWITWPFVKSLYVHCNIQTLCIGSASFYDEHCSMMTQLANNAIDLRLESQRKNSSKRDSIHRRYNESNFWNNGGIKWFCDILRYSYAFSSHLSTIRMLSLRNSNLTDAHLRLLCRAINSRKYESSKSLTIRKLILSKNFGVTDATMSLLFTTIGNKLQYLQELELNDIGITDHIAAVLTDFYTDFHLNYSKVNLYSLSMLGNSISLHGLKMLNRLFAANIIDDNKFCDGNKIFHIGVNGRKQEVKQYSDFDMRLHVVISQSYLNE